MKKLRAGFTVLEMLVTAVLMLLFLTLAWQIMLPGLRIWRENQAQATLEENALVTTTSVVRDLLRGTAASVTVEPGNGNPASLQAVSFATVGEEGSPDSYDPVTGLPIWDTYIIYYVAPGSHVLTRKTWPVPWLPPGSQSPPLQPGPGAAPTPGVLSYVIPGIQPLPLSAVDLATLCQVANGTEHQLSTCVDVFELDPVPILPAGGQITLTLSTSTPFGVEGNHITTTQRIQQFHFWM